MAAPRQAGHRRTLGSGAADDATNLNGRISETTTTGSLIATLLASAVATTAVRAECEITLHSADSHPEGYPSVLADWRKGEMVKECLDGRVCIEVFPSTAA